MSSCNHYNKSRDDSEISYDEFKKIMLIKFITQNKSGSGSIGNALQYQCTLLLRQNKTRTAAQC